MAKTHELKTLPIYFDAVLRGDKTFEIRNNDRDFQAGDTLFLKEYDPAKEAPQQPWNPEGLNPPILGAYTGREILAIVSYVLHDTWGKFGLDRGFVALGLSHVENVAAVEFEDATRGLV